MRQGRGQVGATEPNRHASVSAAVSIQTLDQCLDLGFAPCDRPLTQAHRSRVHAELYPVVPAGPAHRVAPEDVWQAQQGAKRGQAGLVHGDFLFLQVDGLRHRICFRRRQRCTFECSSAVRA